jgi:hypothetical protein
MTVEQFFVEWLTEALPGVPVSGDVPSPIPDTFVTVERVGGGRDDKIDRADLAVQSWGASTLAAAELHERVKAVMLDAVTSGSVSKCRLDTEYNFYDTTTKHPRYQGVFEVVYFL